MLNSVIISILEINSFTIPFVNIIIFEHVQGYKRVVENCRLNAKHLCDRLLKTGCFNILSKEIGVPLVAFSVKEKHKYDEYKISEQLRRFGWIVPACTMAPDAQHVTLLRVVVREDFNETLADRLVGDILRVLHELDECPPNDIVITQAIDHGHATRCF